MPIVECAICKIEFKKDLNEIKRCVRHFCSPKCSGIGKRKKNEIIVKNDHALIIINDNKLGTFESLIDIEDVEKVKDLFWRLRFDGSNYYVEHCRRKGRIHLHRLLIDCPDDKVVDHIDHNGLNNKKENLRICTHQQNCLNKKLSNKNKHGKVGVHQDSRSKRYYAMMSVNGETKHGGYYATLEEAIIAREKLEAMYLDF